MSKPFPQTQSREQTNQLIQAAVLKDQQGRPDQAEHLLRQALHLAPKHPDVLNLLGVLCLRSNRLDEGIMLLKKAVKLSPKTADYHYNLGNGLSMVNDVQAARTAFIKAIKFNPKMVGAYRNLGVMLSRLGQHPAAEEAFGQAMKLSPHNADVIMNHANSLLQQNKKLEALAEYKQVLEHNEHLPQMLWRNLGITFLTIGNDSKAEEAFRNALQEQPKDIEAWLLLGRALANLGEGRAAVKAFLEAEKLGVDAYEVRLWSARALLEAGEYREALQLYHELLLKYPENIELLLLVAGAEGRMGNFDEQEKILRKVLQKSPENIEAYRLLKEVPGREFSAEEIQWMQRLADDTDTDKDDRRALSFTLGDIFRNKKEYDTAFHYFAQGNDLKGYIFDRAEHEDFVSEMIDTFSEDFFREHQDWGSESVMPILIVGTMRSGTTLTEQILAAHPDVAAAGERGAVVQLAATGEPTSLELVKQLGLFKKLDNNTVAEMAQNYLKVMRAHVSESEKMVTNKLPDNFTWLGLFALLFPNAPIIHTRRDPRDSLLSIYFKDFAGIHPHAYNLDDLGFWYAQYQRLMAHWEKVLPNPYMALDYEKMVADQEGMTRQLLDFLGLEWNEQVLSFYAHKRQVKTASLWQVRQPVYTSSVQRWRPYEQHLQPLFDSLEANGVKLDW